MAGRLIRLFLSDGNADGIITMEISNMTIFGTIFPRPLFDQFKKRKESDRPGVYLIFGQDFNTGITKLYIGEGDPVSPRLNAHYGNKDFWNTAIVFTSKDDFLTKTQIQYLESKLLFLAKQADIVVLDNSNMPTIPSISEIELSEVSLFLESILLLMKAMRFDFFIPVVISNIQQSDNDEVYLMKYKTAEAKMLISNGKYILLKGSTVIRKEANAARQPLIEKRKKLIEKNLISIIDDQLMLVKDNLEFDSSSYAASIVAGLGVNGLINWKLNDKTLKQIENERARNNT